MRKSGHSVFVFLLCYLFGSWVQATHASGIVQWTRPVPVAEVNLDEAEEWSPFLSYDGLTLYFTRLRAPDFYYGRIYQAKRAAPWGPFTVVEEVPGTLNSSEGHVLCPWVSPDNLRMYYTLQVDACTMLMVTERDFPDAAWPQGTPITELNMFGSRLQICRLTADELILAFSASDIAGGHGGYDLWIAERVDRFSPFTDVRNIEAANTSSTELAPYISPDGLHLYFASDRNGPRQLFYAERPGRDEPFGYPVCLSALDMPGRYNSQPCLSADGSVLYFLHQTGEDRATRDIYISHAVAAGASAWRDPVPLDEVNTDVHDKAPFLSYDGLTLYFSRDNVPGGFARIYQATRASVFEPFSSGREIVTLTEVGAHVAHPWVSPDELRLYYYSAGGSRRRLRIAERPSRGAAWMPAGFVSELNALGDVANPSLTADELVIVFDALDFEGGLGDRDLWMASRPAVGQPFTDVTNLTLLNTAGPDGHAALSPDGLTLYYASSPTGVSQIFRATRSSRDELFGPPEHLSVFDTSDGCSAYPCISADGQTFYFGAWPDGQYMDIYVSHAASAFYVDATHGRDRNDGGSPATAFATIQKAIDVADDGGVVNVRPGVYREQLHFQGKAITVQGADDAAVLEAPHRFAASFYMGERPDTVLRNFVIAHSYVGIIATDSSPTLTNLTVVGNELGIEAYRNAHPYISNSIVWGNAVSDLYGCTAAYSCIERQADGEGSFSVAPLFADPANGDYHLLSEYGRYWPERDVWVLDDVTSFCVDAGDPGSDFSREREPNGDRINIGAYGGTRLASRSAECQPVCQPGQAYNPSPANGMIVYSANPTLSWTPGSGAATHDVYFGDTNPPSFVGNQVETEFRPGPLVSDTTYWWRIDEVNGDATTTGPVWQFSTCSATKGRSCFLGATPVWIDGTLIPISRVHSGMSVCPAGDVAGQKSSMLSSALGCVEKVQAHQGTFVCYDVSFETGNSICVAECHFFLAESGRWISLQALRLGTRLQTPAGSVAVASITRRPTLYAGTVYNLVVPESHRYLVGKDAVIARDY